jgi:hypothetical protein
MTLEYGKSFSGIVGKLDALGKPRQSLFPAIDVRREIGMTIFIRNNPEGW